MTKNQFEGCLLGLALGDALGAPWEGGLAERLLWRLIGRTRQGEMRWTDDTQISLDLAESLIAHGRVDADDIAARFAKSYRWSRGYGPGAAKLLRIARGVDWRDANRSVYREGSYGNGGAMRAPIIGIYFASQHAALFNAARQSAEITHAHPLGIEGAVLIARAAAEALTTKDSIAILDGASAVCEADLFRKRIAIARTWLAERQLPTAKVVRRQLGNGIAAAESCVTALYIALRFLGGSFTDMAAFTAACRGDVDTIGAMAGAIWGAARGAAALPAEKLAKLEQRDRIRDAATALYERSQP